MAKKHNLHILKTGGSLRYAPGGLHLALNGLYTHLDRPLHPNTKTLYRQHYPEGSDFMNLSLFVLEAGAGSEEESHAGDEGQGELHVMFECFHGLCVYW